MNSPDWHTHRPDELETTLKSNLERGLAERDALRLTEHRSNELPEAPPVSALTLLLGQFTRVIIWVLIGAAIISGLLYESMDAATILAIVRLNALLDFLQEDRAEQSIPGRPDTRVLSQAGMQCSPRSGNVLSGMCRLKSYT